VESLLKRRKPSKRLIIPLHIEEKLLQTTEALAKEYCRFLSIEIKQAYAYVYEEDRPLCRLKYLGMEDEWGFAIFKYSSITYSTNEFMFPRKGSMRECIEVALRAYPHIWGHRPFRVKSLNTNYGERSSVRGRR